LRELDLGGLGALFSFLTYALVHLATRIVGALVVASPLLVAGYLLGWQLSAIALYLMVYFLVLSHASRFVFEGRMLDFLVVGFVATMISELWFSTLAGLAVGALGLTTLFLPWWIERNKAPEEETLTPDYERISQWEVPPKEEQQRKWRAYGLINVATSIISETKKEGEIVDEAKEHLERAEEMYSKKEYDKASESAILARSKIESG
jgi:hypothetical protein